VSALFEAKAWIKHRIQARGPHGVHSPLVFYWITQVLRSDKHFFCFDEIEQLRHQLVKDPTVLTIEDLGAGSRKGSNAHRSIASIVASAANPAPHAQILFRLVNELKPQNILELGTNLGISTAYLAKANAAAQVYSIEGAKSLVDQAQKNLARLGVTNVQLIHGSFQEQLGSVLKKMRKVNFAWIDGHHAEQPTIDYFLQILDYCDDQSILVFDDIHWSPGMERAWQFIKAHARVTLSLDFFHFGIVLFQKGREKEDFLLKLP